MKILGLCAAFLTTLSFVPQVIQIIKTKNTAGISLKMYIGLLFGLILWVIYGFFQKDLPIIFANLTTGLFSSIILFYKLKEK